MRIQALVALASLSACTIGSAKPGALDAAQAVADAQVTPAVDGGSMASDAGSSERDAANPGAALDAATVQPDASWTSFDGGEPSPVFTPTWYVDFESGDDSHDGKLPATAFKHCPGDANATGAAAAASIQAGEGVIFKGGVDYKGMITVNASGQDGKPVVFDGNSAGTFGTGRASVDGERQRDHGFLVQGQPYVVIQGFEIHTFSTDVSSVGVEVTESDHVEVRDNQLSEIYYTTDPIPGDHTWESQTGIGIYFNNSNDGKVINNHVRDCGHAGIIVNASAAAISGFLAQGNEVTNMNIGIRITLGDSNPGTKLSDVHIIGNYIHDFDQYYVCDAWHRDGIHAFARPEGPAFTVEDVEIAGNYFEDNTSGFGSTAWIYVEYACKRFRIHHNVLNQSRSWFAIRFLADFDDGSNVEGDHLVENNTIYNVNGQGSVGMHIGEVDHVTLHNNIFYDEDVGYAVTTSSMPGFVSDYNLFLSTQNTNVLILNAGPAESYAGDGYSLAQAQASTSVEAHSVGGDPMFSQDPKTIDSDPAGFKPKPGSPAIDKGTNVGYTSDFSGTAIPQGAGPDIGAFEQ